jgi:hypothetical protein
VVVSIYVNPTQFGPGEDLTRYPRDLEHDKRLCRAAGVDVVFAPRDREMYFAERLASEHVRGGESLSQGLEGESAAHAFSGVTTVVAKLFHLVLPEVAVFGAKDYQQAAVVRRMVRDLHIRCGWRWRRRFGRGRFGHELAQPVFERQRSGSKRWCCGTPFGRRGSGARGEGGFRRSGWWLS